ncbi:conserved hypothetical protein [Trichinella spiralis]|uniref:hypothetical protein n=1 Tax=Trichinella spiralis TaxID=6334 RepID=UPI0001EFE503|nr:conserved hypothetical protein [Trichinella spiralis]
MLQTLSQMNNLLFDPGNEPHDSVQLPFTLNNGNESYGENRQAKSEKYFDANIQQSPLPVSAENCRCGQFINFTFSLCT